MLSPDQLLQAADRFGTPLYVYDASEIDTALKRVRDAFPGARIFYAMKANSNFAVLRRLRAQGVGFEAVSPGELARTRFLGCAGDEVIVNGPAKSAQEYQHGAEMGATFVIDREEEVSLLPPGARVLVRVNPGLPVSTHDHLATGAAHAKFGVPLQGVVQVFSAAREAGLQIRGLHLHIGSSIRDSADFGVAFGQLTTLAPQLRELGFGQLEVLDVGGGWGLRADLPGIAAAAREAQSAFGARELWVEPGRYLVALAGVLLTRVVGTKRTARSFVLCDAGMTELLRPMLYDAKHPVTPLWDAPERHVYDLAGPACESGDVLRRDVELPTPSPGALLAVGEAGAYGAVMSSSYLSRSRPAEVLWDGGWQLIRRRERPEDVWAAEVEPESGAVSY
ncbi:diaminopimelate decarboxylase [Deinococcus peraridilitoris]|nr:diaminopimelate decarboxylase [Deinococcus peraridilitoris]